MYPSSIMATSRRRPAVPTGFTLIELLVVISIIALMIAILLPALGKAREAAQTVKCLTNLRQQGLGMAVYHQDHKEYYPSHRNGSSHHWKTGLASYVSVTLTSSHWLDSTLSRGTIYDCPGMQATSIHNEYRVAYHSQLIQNSPSNNWGIFTSTIAGTGWAENLKAIRRPMAQLAIVADGNPLSGDGFLYTAVQNSLGYIHAGKPNVLFGDNHAVTAEVAYSDFVIR